jgi:hypothetical protein
MANRTRDTANLVSANNLYVDISADKVGIGTTTPTSKLTVVGDVLVSGILTASHIVGTSLSISGISTLGSVEISSGIVTAKAGTGIVTYYGDGSKLLYVVASSSAVAIATNTTNQSQFLTYVTETGNVSGLGVTTTGLVFNPSTNSLGIGTATPTSKLDVRGDVSIASTLGIGTVIDIVPYDTLNSGTLSWEGSAGQLFSITNNLTTGSIYSVNDVSGIPSIDVDANGTIQLGPYGGNIGLGTTNPTTKLDVRGNVNIVGVSTFTGGIFQLVNTVTISGGIYTLDITASNEFVTAAAINGATTINLSNLANLPTGYRWRGVFSFSYTSGVISWFSGNAGYTVKWDGGSAPTPTAGETETVVIAVTGGGTTIEVTAQQGRA